MKRYSRILVPIFAIIEMLAIALAATIGFYLRHGAEAYPSNTHEAILLISLGLWPILGGLSGYYKDRRTRKYFNSFAHLTILWFLISFFLLSYLVLAKSDISRLSFVYFLTLAYGLLIVAGLIRHQFLINIRSRGRNQRLIGFIGPEVQLSEMSSWLTDNPSFGFQVSSFMTINHLASLETTVQELERLLSETHIDEILIGNFQNRKDILTHAVDIAEGQGCRVRIIQERQDIYSRQLDLKPFGPFRVFSVREEPLSHPPAKIYKRLFDIVFSSLVLLLLYWWIHIIVYVMIKFSSKGPVFFKQKRVGKNGSHFCCYKFRTMAPNGSTEEGSGEITKEADSRITPLGAFLRKTNIDELPQFINVLIGDMSIVGPRPHMLLHTEEYSSLIKKYMVRQLVKPGITGI
ncbi:MAG: sugar transferase, partial [Calditrichaeota bacterium]|nr:sugar transferase [Calditrichota bacterium]